MLPNEKLRRADMVTSFLLVALGMATIVASLRMPLSGDYGGKPIYWYTSPAFFPLLVAVLLILCAIGVLIRARREGGQRYLVQEISKGLRALPTNQVAHRILTIWALLLAYILCLALHPFLVLSTWLEKTRLNESSFTAFLVEPNGTNYVLSSALFLVFFMLVFFRSGKFLWDWKRVALIVFVSLFVSWGVGYLFTQHLLSDLPW